MRDSEALSKPNWQSADLSNFKIHWWEEDAVVFDYRSGNTHRINRITWQIIEALKTPMSFDRLYDKLLSSNDSVQDDVLADHLPSLLEQLETTGLIERVSNAR